VSDHPVNRSGLLAYRVRKKATTDEVDQVEAHISQTNHPMQKEPFRALLLLISGDFICRLTFGLTGLLFLHLCYHSLGCRRGKSYTDRS
jgi:hypothetical protein